MSISEVTMRRLIEAVNGLTDAMTEMAKATDRSTKQVDGLAERLEEKDEEEMPSFPPGSIGEDMVFIDQSGLSSGIPRKGAEDEGIDFLDDDDEDDEWSSPVTHDELIDRLDGDFSCTTAHSLMEQVKLGTMNFSPGVLADFGLSEPHQQDKFKAIQFVVKYCNVSVEELFRTVPLLPNTSHEAIHTLCTSPTHSPYYGSVLWGYGGPKTPK